MTLANLTFQQEQRMMTTRVLTWMSKHYQNYLTDDASEYPEGYTGAIDADALAEGAAWNFGIYIGWARELVEQYRAGKEGR